MTVRLSHVYYLLKADDFCKHLHTNFRILGGTNLREHTPAGVQLFDAYYLGFTRLIDGQDRPALIKAFRQNAVQREGITTTRVSMKKKRTSLDNVTQEIEGYGTAVEEHPCVIVVTPRSVRIIDSFTGETMHKFITSAIDFASSRVLGGPPEVLAVVVDHSAMDEILCHMFFPFKSGTAKAELKVIADTASKITAEHKKLTAAGPFAAFKDAPREAAPDALFKMQVHRADLDADKVLGAGEFGEVWLATQLTKSSSGNKITVHRAVKTLKQGAGGADKDEFLREALLSLAIGRHKNCIRLVGVAVQQPPWLCVLEFQKYGDLQDVVKTLSQKKIKLTQAEFLHVFKQIAAGCAHMHSRKLIHMDIAARNVLVGNDSVMKVADFGMTRPYQRDGPYCRMPEPIRMAVKWGSPEAVHGLVFSEASDVWAVGVTCWEVLNHGKMPWPGENNNSTMLKISRGKRMSKPKQCPQDLWSVLLFTWQKEANDRPSFTQLGEMFQKVNKSLPKSDGIRDIGLLATKSAKGTRRASATVMVDEQEADDEGDDNLTGDDAYQLAVSANDMYATTSDISAPKIGVDNTDSPYAWGFNEAEEDTELYGTPRRRTTMTRAIRVSMKKKTKTAAAARRGSAMAFEAIIDEGDFGSIIEEDGEESDGFGLLENLPARMPTTAAKKPKVRGQLCALICVPL